MNASQKKQAAALSSVFASAFLTGGKLAVGLLTGSLGILSEAAHSALDFCAALITLFAVRAADQPADERHPYGHAKIESVSALIETGLLFLTSFWVAYEAIHRLVAGNVEVETTWYAIAMLIVSIGIDASRAHQLKKVARETQSQALEADALHFSSDIWSSAAVLGGLVLNHFGYPQADALAALVVSGVILHAGYSLGKRTIDVLLDAAPAGLAAQITAVANETEGILGVSKLRVRQAGPDIFVDMVVDVSRGLATSKVKEHLLDLERRIRETIGSVDLTIHPHPVELTSESVMERTRQIAAHHGYTIHHIYAHSLGERTYLNFDLEVESEMPLQKAHDIADRLEAEIQREVDPLLEVNINIEPLFREPSVGGEVSEERRREIALVLEQAAASGTEVFGIHDVRIFASGYGTVVSAHGYVNGEISVARAHGNTERIDHILRARVPQVDRLILHLEPGSQKS